LSSNEEIPLLSNDIASEEASQPSLFVRLKGQLFNYKTLVRFSFASVTFNVVTMAANIVILRWLEPETLGLWQSVMLIQSYSFIMQLGALNGLNRELPYTLGAGDDKTVKELAGTAQSIAIMASFLLIAGGIGSWLVLREPMLRYGALVVFFCSAGAIYRNYLTVTYRAEKAFGTLSYILLFESLMAVVTLPLVYYCGYGGLAGRYLFLVILGMSVNYVYRPLHAPVRFKFKHAVTLVKVGLPLYACGYLLTVSGTFPRLILLSESGVKMVGLFAPIYAVMGLMQMIPDSIAQYIYPHMSYKYGQTGDPRSLWPIAWKVAVYPMVVAIPAVLACLLILPWMIEHYFSKYIESIPAVRYGLISGVFLGTVISINALFSLKAWKWSAIYTGFRVVSSYLLPLGMFYFMVNPLEGVAAGFAIAHGLSFVVGLYCIYRATHVEIVAVEAIQLGAGA
jgi:O-antigen/teichoic acid export membrane protein